MRNIYSYAVIHAKRRKFYSLTIVMVTAISATTMYTSVFYFGSVRKGLATGISTLGSDLIVVPSDASIDLGFVMGAPSNFYMNYSVFETIAELPGVARATEQLFFQTMPPSIMMCCSYQNVKVVAYDPGTDYILGPLKVDFQETRQETGPAIYIGNALPVSVLTTFRLKLYNVTYVLKGQLKPTGIGYIDSSIFIPLDLARKIIQNEEGTFPLFEQNIARHEFTGNEISAVLVKAQNSSRINDLEKEIDNMPGVKAVEMSTMAAYLTGILRNTEAGVWPLLALVVALSIMAIALTFLLSSVERRKEIGIMKAIGALDRDIFRLTVFEGVFLSFLGGSIGVELGIFFSWLIVTTVPRLQAVLPILYPSLGEIIGLVAECLIVSTVIGIVASVYPAYRFSRMAPDEAIREA